MTPTPDHHEKLERLVAQTLRELPPRRAPRSLESRVFAELERRAARPWWQQDFAHWPLAGRLLCFVVLAGIAKLVLMAIVWAMAGFDRAEFTQAFATQSAWFDTIARFAGTMADAGGAVVHSIPSLWIYGTLSVFAALYVALFGLGAAAYRTLYISRS